MYVFIEIIITTRIKGVLQSKFVAMDVFSNVLNDNANPDSLTNSLIKHLIECIGLVLAAQPCAPTFWAQPKTLQSFNAILILIIDNVQKYVKVHMKQYVYYYVMGMGNINNNIVTCLEQILKSATKNCKPVLIILPLIQDVLPYLLDDDDNNSNNNNKKKTGKPLKETSAGRLIFALRTQAFLSDNKFSELTFRSFQNSVVPKQLDGNTNATTTTTTKWSTDLLHLFLNTLMDLRPGHQQQVQAGESYLPLLADAMVCMYRGNKNVSMNLLPRAVTTTQTFLIQPIRMCIVGHVKLWHDYVSIALMKMKLLKQILH